MRITDTVRVQAELVKYFGTCIGVWFTARAQDDSREIYGVNQGSGKATLPLSYYAETLNRKPSTIYKYLAEAKKKGLIRSYQVSSHQVSEPYVTIYYTSLEKVAQSAGIENIGPVSEVDINKLKDLKITATEITAMGLQRESAHKAKLDEEQRLKENNQGSIKVQIPDPMKVADPSCGTPARALGYNNRFLFVSENFLDYGGSQETIGQRLGISSRTVQRHLSNSYRLKPSPVRKFRANLEPALKRQIAIRLKRSFKPMGRSSRDAEIASDERRILKIGDRYFEARNNIYALNHCLVPCRFRRHSYKKNFRSQSEVRGGAHDKNILSSENNFREREGFLIMSLNQEN